MKKYKLKKIILIVCNGVKTSFLYHTLTVSLILHIKSSQQKLNFITASSLLLSVKKCLERRFTNERHLFNFLTSKKQVVPASQARPERILKDYQDNYYALFLLLQTILVFREVEGNKKIYNLRFDKLIKNLLKKSMLNLYFNYYI